MAHTSTNCRGLISDISRLVTAVYTHLLVAQVQELVELNTPVGEGTEGPPLLEVGGDLGVSDISLFRAISTSFSQDSRAT